MKKRIPKFAGEDQERDFWATHDSTAYLDWKKAKRIALPKLEDVYAEECCCAKRLDREETHRAK